MKKIAGIIGAAVLMLMTAIEPAQALLLQYDGIEEEYTSRIFSLLVNGEKVESEMPPVILADRTFVPARAVFEKAGAQVLWDGDQRKVTVLDHKNNIEMYIGNKQAVVNGNTIVMEQPARIINDRTMLPLRFVGESLGMAVGWFPEKEQITLDAIKQEMAKLQDIQYVKSDAGDYVELIVEGLKNYRIFTFDPYRIVIDISNTLAALPGKGIEVNGRYLSGIRYSQFDEKTARVVLDKKAVVKYAAAANGNTLKIYLSNDEMMPTPAPSPSPSPTPSPTPKPGITPAPSPSATPKPGTSPAPGSSPSPVPSPTPTPRPVYPQPTQPAPVKNNILPTLQYYNKQDRVHLVINGIDLTDGEKLNKVVLSFTDTKIPLKYKETWDAVTKKYTLSFPNTTLHLGNAAAKINDDYLLQVETKEDTVSGTNYIILSAKGDYKFEVFGHTRENETAINIVKPRQKTDRLVVIGAGHGGSDPGAGYGGIINEKYINLDIALRLNALLKAKGVNTYMLREDDRFVGLYERTAIANSLNAELFISIHNNSITSPDVKGTLTICNPARVNPNGFGSKRLAEIIQAKMVAALGTVNRNLLQEPAYVEVKATNMPAIITEGGFVTNKEDRENLLDPAYRQKTAQALCDGILQALQENNK